MLKQDTHFFFNNIFTYIITPHPPRPLLFVCDGFGKFFGRLFLKTIFFATQPIQNIFINFYFLFPRCATGRENFLYRTFCGKIFVSNPRKLHINPPYQFRILNHLLIRRRENLNYIHMELYTHYI